MIRRAKGPRGRLVFYALPIIIGLGGVVFSQQLPTPMMRVAVLVLSVSIPIFAGGNMLARYHAGRFERFILFAGVVMLALGAVMGLSDIRETLETEVPLPPILVSFARIAGLVGVLAGLFVVLYMVARTGEDIDEISERFRHVADRINEGFVMSSPGGAILMVNSRFLEMLDLRRDEVIGTSVFDLSERMDASIVGQQFENRARGVTSEYEVVSTIRGERRHFWFSGSPITDASGSHTATLATVRDITEMHRLAKKARESAEALQQLVNEQSKQLDASEEQFRGLLLSMNEGFLTLDADYRIRFANQRIADLLAIGAEELPGRDVFDFVDTPGRVRLMNLFAQTGALAPSESRQEISFVNTRGEYVPTVAAVASAHEAGEAPVYSLVLTSVADLKQMQRRLEERATELQRVNEELRLHGRARDGFLSNVSHELRTPLSTIQGYLEMLQAGTLGELNDKQAQSVTVMARNAQRLLTLINEMIEFSRIEIRGVQLDMFLFSAERLVQDFAASILPHTQAKGVAVACDIPERLPPVWGDRNRLGQVLGILLNNAVKFTDEGGQVSVAVARLPESTLEISVSDTGIGIDPAHHEQIFTKFFQVDSSKTRRYEGAGIGLSLAKSIVEAHGGHIRLRSAKGEGSTFTVALPNALFDAAMPEPPPQGFEGVKILIARTDGELDRAVRPALEALGCNVSVCESGHACARAAERDLPDVIVISDSEKDRTGLATLPPLRQNPATQDIPALVVSSENVERQHEVRTTYPGVDVLARPFSLETLLNRIEAVLDGGLAGGFAGALAGEAEPAADTPCAIVIDADPGLREWAETALRCRGIPCLCAATPQRALDIFRDRRPGVIFLDVDVPGAAIADHLLIFEESALMRDVPIYVMTGVPGWLEAPPGVAGVLEKPAKAERMAELARAAAPGAAT